ncbi:uncharacterized protein AB675_142 [Cyphellophora attinorum]|uniref:Xylanolytic transcriptional activator regulatory domain-containing protein n=1 Tax=Cyphellophora attinorum TaxID=1664694 RepID=A0A0N0NK48_9EURO|nr:uncharacterized protein AB675_142 [Phialophora attinorum]KPI37731.1 hypothetical protein AB675_142 [Phialophora attinorum]
MGGTSAPTLLQRMISLAPNNSSDLLFAFFGGTDGQTVTSDRDLFGQMFPAHYGVPEMVGLLHAMGKEQLEQHLDSAKFERCITADSLPPPQEVALIFAILALGDLVGPDESSWQFISASLHLLRISKFLTMPSLDTVATFSYIAVYLQHEGRLNEYWPLMGMVIRIAQSMGLHRDPRWISNLSREEAEVRRRIFHTIAAQETALSIMFGRPTGLGYFDTDLPEDISDDHLFGGDVNHSVAYPHEISYNRCTFQLMEIIRTVVQDSTSDIHKFDLARARSGQKRILDWFETLPALLQHDGSVMHAHGLVGVEERARCVQSLVLHMIVNHSILVIFRKPLLETSSPEAAEPCFRAAIAISASWKVLQDSFPKMASITFMHWFRAFHAALICLVAIRAPNTTPTIRDEATSAWHSCKRIFLRLGQQNESMKCCSRALQRLDPLLKTGVSTRRRKSTASTQKVAVDSSSQLRVGRAPDPNAGMNSDAGGTYSALAPADFEAVAGLSAEILDTQIPVFDQQSTPSTQNGMDYGQVFQSVITEPTLANTGLAPDEHLYGVMHADIFDMDANNWPSWLINDQDSTEFFNI